MAEKRAERKRKNRWLRIYVGCIIAALIADLGVGLVVYQYRKGQRAYEKTASEYITENTDAEDGSIKEWWELIDVDIAGLKSQNEDVAAWLYFENEEISYPVMYSGDNDKYLKTLATGERGRSGALFIDMRNTPDFSDPHTVIYGHNMQDTSMFGKLKYYRKKDNYYKGHEYFQIITEDSIYRYRIFAYEDVSVEHSVFNNYGPDPKDIEGMVKKLIAGSYLKAEEIPENTEHVVTLSTCTANDENRFVVSAIRVEEHDRD